MLIQVALPALDACEVDEVRSLLRDANRKLFYPDDKEVRAIRVRTSGPAASWLR
jgi:hypothetical protein